MSAAHEPLEGARSTLAWWTWVAQTSEIWWTRTAGRDAIDAARASRLASLIAFTRERSPFYRNHWRDVAPQNIALGDFPVVAKRDLMADFDAWTTDPDVTRHRIDAVLAARSHIGDRLLHRHAVWNSSGTTSKPG